MKLGYTKKKEYSSCSVPEIVVIFRCCCYVLSSAFVSHCLSAAGSCYLEGQGDLRRLIMGMTKVTIWLLGVINLLSKSPDPPSAVLFTGGCCFEDASLTTIASAAPVTLISIPC